MGSYNFLSFYAMGPSMVLSPPTAPHQLIQSRSTSAWSYSPTAHHHSHNQHYTQWTPSTSSTPVTTNPSRKRSRQDFDSDAPSATDVVPPHHHPRLAAPRPAVARTAFAQDATSIMSHSTSIAGQTGVSFGEPAATTTGTGVGARAAVGAVANTITGTEAATVAASNPFAQTLPSRKSQRLDSSLASSVHGAPKSSSLGPKVDDSTLALGLSWTRLDDDADMQAAARGWAKYIERRHNIHNPNILLKNRALNAYLVTANEGFFMFKEDLLEGQLVSTDWQRCLANLRCSPISFEGFQTLKAELTPSPESDSVIGQQEKHEQLVGADIKDTHAGSMDLD